MTKSRLILEYSFLSFLVVILVIMPAYYSNKQMIQIRLLQEQLAREKEMREQQQRQIDLLARKQIEFSRQVQCLAVNVYHEARGEGERGMQAVAQVTVNRTKSDNFPDDICGVVYQKNSDGDCQFSWYCDGKSDEIKDQKSWTASVRVATEALEGKVVETSTKTALYYHSKRVKPRWSHKKKFVAVIGRHIFYSEFVRHGRY